MSSIVSSIDEEKAFLVNIANMYLDGYSLREIAKKVNLSHVTIHKYLREKLVQYDPLLASEVMEEMSKNTPKSIYNEEVTKRVLESYFMLVNDGKTLAEIAMAKNVSIMVTTRDLTKRLLMLHQIAPSVVTKQMVSRAAEVLSEHSLENLKLGGLSTTENQERDKQGRFV